MELAHVNKSLCKSHFRRSHHGNFCLTTSMTRLNGCIGELTPLNPNVVFSCSATCSATAAATRWQSQMSEHDKVELFRTPGRYLAFAIERLHQQEDNNVLNWTSGVVDWNSCLLKLPRCLNHLVAYCCEGWRF